MTTGFAHNAPLELCAFLGHHTINIALLAELGLRNSRPVARSLAVPATRDDLGAASAVGA